MGPRGTTLRFHGTGVLVPILAKKIVQVELSLGFVVDVNVSGDLAQYRFNAALFVSNNFRILVVHPSACPDSSSDLEWNVNLFSITFSLRLYLGQVLVSGAGDPSRFRPVRPFPDWECQTSVLIVALKEEWEFERLKWRQKNDFTLQQTTSIAQTWNVSKDHDCPKRRWINLCTAATGTYTVFPAVKIA